MKRHLIKASFLAGLLLLQPAWAKDEPVAAESAAQQSAQPQPKFFVWGILVSAIRSEVFSMFTKWLFHKIGDHFSTSIPMPKEASPVRMVPAGGTQEGMPAETVSGTPSVPLKVNGSEANYQGVHIAIAVLNMKERTLGLRPVDQGYRTGERFKLRVIPTFEGDMKIENINPMGVRKQIYPADPDMRIRLEPGKETLIPAGKDQYFEFTKATGKEQLLITLRDPRATATTTSSHKVYRQDETYGSNFVQEVARDKYPVISESIDLVHY